MVQFATWLDTLSGKPKLMGWPLPVDFMFVYWYYIRFVGDPPFGYDGIDIKTYAMRVLDVPVFADVSRTKARELLGIPNVEFSHDPTYDAAQQAAIFFGLRRLIGR